MPLKNLMPYAYANYDLDAVVVNVFSYFYLLHGLIFEHREDELIFGGRCSRA